MSNDTPKDLTPLEAVLYASLRASLKAKPALEKAKALAARPLITLKCEDDTFAFDQRKIRVLVMEETPTQWLVVPLEKPLVSPSVYPKFAWKKVK